MARLHGALAGGEHGGVDAGQLVEIGPRGEQEDPAVPEEGTALQEALGGGEVRLLDEAIDHMHAFDALQDVTALDVAVAGVRPGWLDAEGHQAAVLRRGKAPHDGAMEGLGVGDDVIGGLDEHQCVGIARQQPNRGGGDRRTGVARHRLEQDRLRFDADLAKLLVDQEAMLVVADEQRRRKAHVAQVARRRFLQQRALRHQRQQLLGIGGP